MRVITPFGKKNRTHFYLSISVLADGCCEISVYEGGTCFNFCVQWIKISDANDSFLVLDL